MDKMETQINNDELGLLDVLTELESLKGLIYQGMNVAAYRQVQKMSDKIKHQIAKERKNANN